MFLQIALKDLKIIMKDRAAFLSLILSPVILMLILGLSLNSIFSLNPTIEKFDIALINKDISQDAKRLIEQFTKNSEATGFKIYVVGENEAKQMLNKNKVKCIVTIPNDFFEKISDKSDVVLDLESLSNDNNVTAVVASALDGQLKNTKIVLNIANILRGELSKNNSEQINNVTAIANELMNRISQKRIIFVDEQEQRSKKLSSIAYYSVTMLIMNVLVNVIARTKSLQEEKETKTLMRLMSTRTSEISLYLGKFLAVLVIGMIQSLILISFTALVFKVNWGQNIGATILLTLCLVIAGTGVGMMIVSFTKTTNSANVLSTVFIQLSAFIGGGMIPIHIMSESMKQTAKITINWWAYKGYEGLMLGNGISTNVLSYLILICTGVVGLSIGITRFKLEMR